MARGSSPHTRGAHSRTIPSTSASGIIPAYAGSTPTRPRPSGCRRDHPRIRGEHSPREPAPHPARGSSPHTRGARRQRPVRHRRPGIIPAYAGSTGYSIPAAATPSDHPRIRGEHQTLFLAEFGDRGSSPHTRGALVKTPSAMSWRGIIPAYAGSTHPRHPLRSLCRDHPRIRGEHWRSIVPCWLPFGSSPHTRGARGHNDRPRPFPRIIPAYAGSTLPRRAPAAEWWDHPRIRGEHCCDRVPLSIHFGSSPHTRGARRRERLQVAARRIIPAYAGSTISWSSQPPEAADHPRIRGEHDSLSMEKFRARGSSPHTRGALRNSVPHGRSRGIIPAYAGSTTGRTGWRPLVRDHPRIRGEHPRALMVGPRGRGSSPHTRGARADQAGRPVARRIIPAYAGSTRPHGTVFRMEEDHPRIRGEHQEGVCSITCTPGSSPHTRGALLVMMVRMVMRGIIPAYAGSTSPVGGVMIGSGDHPRIRGEHTRRPRTSGSARGSSPHTRGAPSKAAIERKMMRIIPAYAGSTRLWRPCRRRPGDHPRIRGEHSWKSLQYQGSPP